MMAAVSRGSLVRRTRQPDESACVGAAQSSSTTAAASARRADVGRTNLDNGGSTKSGASMTSLLFGRGAVRRGAHRCANDVVVDAGPRCNRPASNEIHWEAGALRQCKRRTTPLWQAREARGSEDLEGIRL
jgi:hypothetical protein